MPRKQNENLKKGKATRFKSGEEAVKAGRKGGIASGKARREKADLRKQIQLFFESEATTDKNGNPLTGAELMVKVAVKEMTKGNPKYWELLRDTGGFKPVDKVVMAEVDQDIIDEVEAMVLGTEKKRNAKNNTKKNET
jgi:hypothetical protein